MQTFFVKFFIAIFEKLHFIKEKFHMASAEFIVVGLIYKGKFSFSDNIGNAREFPVFRQKMLIAELGGRDEIDTSHKK